ncbi:tRNA 2-thiouridine(34) synthase MnmA [Candidatus Pacearchaeota archaeon]|nr:tRNA 2-thiouridine(34) synthase MnmA [Candidatus Pacearchaeota archaeon]
MKQKTVLLALSGGVDSAIAGYLLKQQGYTVKTVFFKLYSDTKDPLTGNCSYLKDLTMARKIAAHYHLPLTVIDEETTYKQKVLKPMYRAFQKGTTPNPDLPCNALIKFPLLRAEAHKQHCQYIATGHYAHTKKGKLYKPKDNKKDQTYFLAQLTEQDLKNTLFPLHTLTKEQVRKKANLLNLPNWNKPSTAGICFIGGMPFQQFITQKVKGKQGKIVNPEGKQIGTHQGIQQFTIGQHINVQKPKGMQKKWFVAQKQGTTLIAAPEGHPSLYTKKIKLKNIHAITSTKLPKDLEVKIRYRSPPLQATLQGTTLTLARPQTGIAPGQYVAFYKKKECLGCAEIA